MLASLQLQVNKQAIGLEDVEDATTPKSSAAPTQQLVQKMKALEARTEQMDQSITEHHATLQSVKEDFESIEDAVSAVRDMLAA